MPGNSKLLVAFLAAIGCSSANNQSSAIQRDSAGIQIVQSAQPKWSPDEAWKVDSLPVLDLAAAGTGPDYRFFRVRDAATLPDGRIAVANAGTNEVRLYGSDGRFLLATGREGKGPGEYERLTSVESYRGDSIVTFDYWAGRVTVLDSSGAMGRVAPLMELSSHLRSLYTFPDGRFLLRTSPLEALAEAHGRVRPQIPLLLLAPDGSLQDTVAVVPGNEDFVYETGDAAPPLERETYVAVHDSLVYIGTGDDFEFRVLGRHGTVRRIVRMPDYDLRVPESVRDSLKQRKLQAKVPAILRPAWKAMANSIPTRWPAYSDLLVDPTGNVWVEEYTRRSANPSESRHWFVFDASGIWLGTVDLPSSFDLYEVGEDYLLGRSRDALDVETVKLLRLDRS